MSAEKYDLVLITTCVDDKHMSTMINSVIDNNNKLSVLILCLNQSESPILHAKDTACTEVYVTPLEKSSLSHVRNLGLKHLNDRSVSYEHVMFPDDDTVFCNKFFERYKSEIKKGENYLINVLNYNSSGAYKVMKLNPNQLLTSNHYRFAMSVNMIVAKEVVCQISGFDEQLGVGTANGSSEDADFFIRSNSVKAFCYCDRLFNYHPKNISKFKKMSADMVLDKLKSYSVGNIKFLKKHGLTKDYNWLLIRTVCAMFYYFFTLNFKMFYVYIRLLSYRVELFFAKL